MHTNVLQMALQITQSENIWGWCGTMVGLVHHEGSRVIVMHVAIVVGWVAVWCWVWCYVELTLDSCGGFWVEVGCSGHGGLEEMLGLAWERKDKKGILRILEVHQAKNIVHKTIAQNSIAINLVPMMFLGPRE